MLKIRMKSSRNHSECEPDDYQQVKDVPGRCKCCEVATA